MNMKVRAFQMAACIAWAAVALSSAAPAQALLITKQSGEYANCSAEYVPVTGWTSCHDYFVSYRQVMKLIAPPCSTGTCPTENAAVWPEAPYAAGRKSTIPYYSCIGANGTWYLYGINPCSC